MFFSKMTIIFLSIFVLFTFSFFQSTNACKCALQTVEKATCSHYAVVHVKITSGKTEYGNRESLYHFKKIELLRKIDKKGMPGIDSGRLITPTDSAACGVEFEKDKEYIIFGRSMSDREFPYLEVASCDFPSGVPKVFTQEEKSAVQDAVKKSCPE